MTYTKEIAKQYYDGDIKGSENIDFYKSQISSLCCGNPIDVLDLGCGTGRYIDSLINVNTYVGVDMSECMQGYAKDKCKRLNINANFVLQSIFEYEQKADCFDLIICVGLMNEQVDFFNDKFIMDCVSWLRNNGRAYFTVNAKYKIPLSREQVFNYLDKIGVNFEIGYREGRGNKNQIWKHWLVTINK